MNEMMQESFASFLDRVELRMEEMKQLIKSEVFEARMKTADDVADLIGRLMPKAKSSLVMSPAAKTGSKTTKAISKAFAEINSDRKNKNIDN